MDQLKFAHLTDIHLLGSYEGSTYEKLFETGLPLPSCHLELALQQIEATYKGLDFLLITGDLVHEGTPEDYRYLKRLLSGVPMPVLLCLGNHDRRDAFWKGYFEEDKSAACYYTYELKGFRMIILDSSQPFEGSGKIDEAQLVWLKKQLSSPARNGSFIALHHPPVCGIRHGMLSQEICLRNADELYACIEGSDVRAIFSGHTHQPGSMAFGGVPQYCANSVAFGVQLAEDHYSIHAQVGFNYCIANESGVYAEPVGIPDGRKEIFRIDIPGR